MTKHPRSKKAFAPGVLILLLMAILAGCSPTRYCLTQRPVATSSAASTSSAFSSSPGFFSTSSFCSPLAGLLSRSSTTCSLDRKREIPWPLEGSSQELSQRFLALAQRLSEADDPRSTDYYFQAAMLSWPAVAEPANGNVYQPCSWKTYQTSLAGLLTDAQRFGRIQCGQLRIHLPAGPQDIPLAGNGLLFPVEQLSTIEVVDNSARRKLKRHHATAGLGVPVVAIRERPRLTGHDVAPTEEQFYPPSLPLAATVILRPRYGDTTLASAESASDFVLELANPLQVSAVRVGERELPIARDLSAPLEKLLELRPSKPITGFLLPGSETSDEGLKWLEPYQPGKIPVVLVHGLLSDPSTWLDMVNDLRTHDWFNAHYQVWGFSYATGSPFVTSAMKLRFQLREAHCMIDPHSQDAALEQMVLVGHSMGGLVAKLQVTDSGDRVWNSLSRVPLDSIHASEEVKQNLADRLYFQAQPFVKRVVYIATPHQGSSLAVRGVGRISSALVRPDELQQARHRKLTSENPDAFFGTFRRRIPTSIDLLEPSDCTLQTIYDLPVPASVVQHTIAGTGKGPWTLGRSDGVVNLESAHHPASVSRVCVPAAHTDITRSDDTIGEVTRLLQVHLQQSGCRASTEPISTGH